MGEPSDSPERLRDATLSARLFDPHPPAQPPARARAVVIGGGIIGASVAYHLAALGWTRHRAAGASQPGRRHELARGGPDDRARAAHVLTELAAYSGAFYAGLERLGPRRRLPRERLAVAGAHARAPDRASLRARHGAPPRPAGSRADARRHRRGLASARRGGARWRRAVRGRRHREPRRGRPRHGQGGLRPGRAHRGGLPRDRLPPARGAPRGRGDRPWPRGVRGRGDRRRPVVARSGAAHGSAPAAVCGRAHVGADGPLQGAARDLPIVRDLDGHFYARHYRGGLVIGAFEPDGKPRPESPYRPTSRSASSRPTGGTSSCPWTGRAPACRRCARPASATS